MLLLHGLKSTPHFHSVASISNAEESDIIQVLSRFLTKESEATERRLT